MSLSRRRLPDLVTGVRLALLPVLWLLALLGHTTALGWLLILAWFTDVLDGFLARRLRVTSRRGSRLDTVADHLLLVSMLAWVLMLEREFVREQAGVLALVVLLWAASLAAEWLRFRRFADLHLYSSKVGVFAAVVFTVHLLIAADYSLLFFLPGGRDLYSRGLRVSRRDPSPWTRWTSTSAPSSAGAGPDDGGSPSRLRGGSMNPAAGRAS